MTARLPTPGSDGNNWGTILNDYLQQSLATDGTLVTVGTNPYTGTANTNLASTSKPGLMQIAGDVGGTAASPTIVGLQGRAVSATAPTDGYVLTWNATGSQWKPAAATGGGGGGGGSGYTGDIDGGSASSVYGGTTSIDCGASV